MACHLRQHKATSGKQHSVADDALMLCHTTACFPAADICTATYDSRDASAEQLRAAVSCSCLLCGLQARPLTVQDDMQPVVEYLVQQGLSQQQIVQVRLLPHASRFGHLRIYFLLGWP